MTYPPRTYLINSEFRKLPLPLSLQISTQYRWRTSFFLSFFSYHQYIGKITTIAITVGTSSETLDHTTSYNYTVSYDATAGSNVVQITAASPYSVGYALISLAQVLESDSSCGGTFTVSDYPHYVHRGIMVDTGRRFYPIPLVQSILDGMELNKLNVLHFHLSEECFRVESKTFPQLTAGCKTSAGTDVEYYTQDEIVALVAYAKDRGIRVLPEFDMPGPSKKNKSICWPRMCSRTLMGCSDSPLTEV